MLDHAPASARDAEPANGLVTCATTARDLEPGGREGWSSAFPGVDLVDAAVGFWQRAAAVSYGGAAPGQAPEVQRQPYILQVAGGTVGLAHAHMGSRAGEANPPPPSDGSMSVDVWLALHGEGGTGGLLDEAPELFGGGRKIRGWSPKSRARLRRCLSELDYGGFVAGCGVRSPVMVTLTYPGDWASVAPNMAATKGHLRAWFERWRRQFGARVRGVWKLEFQRRGAPHFHVMVPVPAGQSVGVLRKWVASSWSEVVDHPDAVQRARHLVAGTAVDVVIGRSMTDPRRVATYFLKHGGGVAKEYQHIVPVEWEDSGAGRFWGVVGMRRHRRQVPLTMRQYVMIRRVLRRYWASKRITRECWPSRPKAGRLERVDGQTGEVTGRLRRRVRRRARSVGGTGDAALSGAWVSVEDGPSFVVALAGLIGAL